MTGRAPRQVHERDVYLVLDFRLRAGEVLLAGGAGTADVTATTTAPSRARRTGWRRASAPR